MEFTPEQKRLLFVGLKDLIYEAEKKMTMFQKQYSRYGLEKDFKLVAELDYERKVYQDLIEIMKEVGE